MLLHRILKSPGVFGCFARPLQTIVPPRGSESLGRALTEKLHSTWSFKNIPHKVFPTSRSVRICTDSTGTRSPRLDYLEV